jgi:seryl-tRNA synthetase
VSLPLSFSPLSFIGLCLSLSLSLDRILIAIIENNYRPEDGCVVIPSVLRPYMGGLETITVQTHAPQPVIDPPKPEYS